MFEVSRITAPGWPGSTAGRPRARPTKASGRGTASCRRTGILATAQPAVAAFLRDSVSRGFQGNGRDFFRRENAAFSIKQRKSCAPTGETALISMQNKQVLSCSKPIEFSRGFQGKSTFFIELPATVVAQKYYTFFSPALPSESFLFSLKIGYSAGKLGPLKNRDF